MARKMKPSIRSGDQHLVRSVRAGGAMGIPGIYTNLDPGAPKTEMAKKGELPIAFSKAWIKSPQLLGGQAPIMKYNRDLMMAILWDRMPYLAEVVNTEVITLEDAPEAYKVFSDGSPKKFVIDPHVQHKEWPYRQRGGTNRIRS